jgi:hypothetical protein
MELDRIGSGLDVTVRVGGDSAAFWRTRCVDRRHHYACRHLLHSILHVSASVARSPKEKLS